MRICADDVERLMGAGDRSDRDDLEGWFITWCEGLLAEMLDHVTAAYGGVASGGGGSAE